MADSYAPVFEGAVRGHNGSAVADGEKYRGALGVMCSCKLQTGCPQTTLLLSFDLQLVACSLFLVRPGLVVRAEHVQTIV